MTTSKNSAIFFSFFWGRGGGGASLALDEAMNSGVGEPSNDDTYKKIWSLNMPNKVNSFAWRACRNILPTKANLCRMYVKLVDSV